MKEAWAVKPKDISADQIVCTHYADIVIIGAGHAGTPPMLFEMAGKELNFRIELVEVK